ncbi:vitamin K-dependent gamma-carboxylase [Psychroflexus torquis ATCC 700755]|uniref:Vitamin K-dependent gamma-carboxylase n=1 Tax=Psychroflexus torquis (strain ATCC 700755 / CIP 106069 / ACAM 623) TaxID=313595 RepID=K4IGP8_PSYTT|nr:HTTM domain-containing protein [Psychroflexus torquis]AFU69504.1 vitamin K-dependent gamma-carboxylase [Psychroflexus torquis ATCC 700755]
MNNTFTTYYKQQVEAAPLAVFRVFFGVMMLFSVIRFWSYGWIDKLYLQPSFSFSYYGFEWIQPLGIYTYGLFAVCGISALCVALGFKYRIAVILFFLSFTYIELMDKTTYLNHYYFVSCVSFMMIFLPAHRYFSVDAYRNRSLASFTVPQWTIDSLKVMLTVVYFFAGLAKLNSDWLVEAMPLKIWLPSKYDIPLLGDLMQQEWVHYAFSYGGAGYDLLIPFLLFYKRTRWFAFAVVVVFHVLTRVLFPIGIFPYVMIVSALIFFDASVHHKILAFISRLFKISKEKIDALASFSTKKSISRIAPITIAVFLCIQALVPWRYLAYPGELFWTEEGYRFSWRVMLMEKAGYAQFTVKDTQSGKQFAIDNRDFLTPFQEKQMSTQPDFILEYAHFLGTHFGSQGHKNIAVFVESYVALNGRLSQPYIDPKIDLMQVKNSFAPKDWLLPFNDKIEGL